MKVGFKPTYLYIKRHLVTGKLYLGKTLGTEEYLLKKYNGSGTYWKHHIKKHGRSQIETLWHCLFIEQESINEFCDLFCKNNSIGYGDLSIWANEKPENGVDGAPKGNTNNIKGNGGANKGKKFAARSDESKARTSASLKNKPKSKEHIENHRNALIRNGTGGNGGANKGKKLNVVVKKKPPQSVESNLRRSHALKNRKITEEHREKLRKPKGPQEIVKCPYCSKEGGISNMQRYHFDNCKDKK